MNLIAAAGLPVNSSNAVQILLLVGGLTLVPAVLFTVTGFSRILIVLGFIRTAVGTTTAPPNQVLVGIALFLTIFVMAPTVGAIKKDAVEPLEAQPHQHHRRARARRAAAARIHVPPDARARTSRCSSASPTPRTPHKRAEVPTEVLIPAFIVSELKTAFQIGFLIFLPFLMIDLIVSSVLMSMGMIMLPPTFISLPFKILLFVLVDGWDLVIKALVQSFHLQMNQDTVVNLATQAMSLALKIAGPLLLVALVVGLLISVFQAVTQIQEQSLSLIPKIAAVAVVIVAARPVDARAARLLHDRAVHLDPHDGGLVTKLLSSSRATSSPASSSCSRA